MVLTCQPLIAGLQRHRGQAGEGGASDDGDGRNVVALVVAAERHGVADGTCKKKPSD